jgi:hypothetical protein
MCGLPGLLERSRHAGLARVTFADVHLFVACPYAGVGGVTWAAAVLSQPQTFVRLPSGL